MVGLTLATYIWLGQLGSQKREPVIQVEPGFIRAVFFSGKESLTLILPDQICSEDKISGTVFATNKEFKMENLQIDIGDAHGTAPEPSSARRNWAIPKTEEPRISITAWTTDGVSWGTTFLPIATAKERPKAFNIPSFERIGAPFVIKGPFDGDPGTTSVKNGDQDLPIVAESPRQVVALIPTLSVPGETSFDVSEDAAHVKATTRILLVALVAGKTSLNRGDRTTLTMSVEGIQGLTREQSPMIIIENRSPKVIDLDGKVKHFVVAQPSKDGDFNHDFLVTSLLGGNFSVTATVDPGPGTNVAPGKS